MSCTPLRCLAISLVLLSMTACVPKERTAPQNAPWKASSAPTRQRSTVNAPPAPSPAVAQPDTAPYPPAVGQPSLPMPVAGQTPPVSPAATLPPNGFGGIAWGSAAGKIPGLGLFGSSTETGVTTYLWPQGPQDIVGAPIREAYYEFYRDRFYHVWINLDGMAAYKTALAGLILTHGPPTEDKPEKYYHAWMLGDVNIYCVFHPGYAEGDVSFFYQPIYDQMMAARKAARNKPARRSKS